MRIASSKYRLQLPGFELPEALRIYQHEYDEHSAQMLEEMADAIEGKRGGTRLSAEDVLEPLEQVLKSCCAPGPQRSAADRIDSFVSLLGEIDRLTASLRTEIRAAFRPDSGHGTEISVVS